MMTMYVIKQHRSFILITHSQTDDEATLSVAAATYTARIISDDVTHPLQVEVQ
jgi:hypothetical protein